MLEVINEYKETGKVDNQKHECSRLVINEANTIAFVDHAALRKNTEFLTSL